MEHTLQLLQINYKPGAHIYLALDRHLERVVVAVTIRVIAFAEDAFILLRAQLRIMVVVGSGKLSSTSQVDHDRVAPLSGRLSPRIAPAAEKLEEGHGLP